eukprot:scaffold33588_cov128-Skeletonema_dohrnii-CCMP3373.AAC.8
MDVFGSRNNNVTIMTFNPFKTTSSSKSSPHHKQHVSDNDSWHSQPPQSVPSSGPLSWFSSGWTPSTTTPQSMPTDNKQTNATSVSPASTLAAPASPMIMLRASHSEGDMNTTNTATMASRKRTDGHNIDRGTTIKSNVGNDLPSYPEQRIQQQQQQQKQSMNNQSDRDTNEKLLEDFPPKANRTLLEEFPSKHNQNKATDTTARKRIKPCIGDSQEAYPGFALYQTARVQYCLGKYNEALDTTTECLAFQKLALGSSKASTTSPKLRPRSSMKTANSAKTDDDSNNDMTALDLRSTFVTGVGRSMLGVVQSMKTSSTSDSGTSTSAQKQQQSYHHASPHPMLSNSMATIIAQYPLHPCIAQTLLLRGRVLADCGLYGLDFDGDTDFSLLLQAIRNVEMAVAILRKIDHEYDLATSLVLLGTLRTLLGHFDEADRAYEEALSLFRVLRLAAKYDQSQAIDEETTATCEISMRRINEGAADAFYRRGKLYQSRRMHEEAFQCYHKSLTLSKCNGVKRRDGCVRRVVRCMKNRSAIESIVSSYMDGSQCSIAYCDI